MFSSEEIQRERAKGRGLYMGHKLFIPGTYARFGLMHSLTPTGDYCSGGSGIMLDQIAVQVSLALLVLLLHSMLIYKHVVFRLLCI